MTFGLHEALKDLVGKQSSLIREAEGVPYRDLNKNGKLDIYEDPRQPVEARVEDLLRQMTLEEKAGTMFINGSVVNEDGSIDDLPGTAGPRLSAKTQMARHQMTHFNLWAIPSVKAVAAWHNRIQAFAEQTRLGIPLTIASDPRNHFSRNIFEMLATEFSQWPNPIGFGAIGDPEVVREFAEFIRQEYLAAGIRMALHPQIDLATEPRWPRIPGTFGEDAQISAALAKAYIEGLQGEKLGPTSVACMTKHFPGGGPQNEGWDSHFEFHKGQVYPGNNFEYHLIPFEAAFEAGTAAVMPYYGVPMDQTDENVGMSYNKAIITGLLREKYQYDGVVCTDWGLVTDTILPETVWRARAWGVEHLSRLERVQKILEAGADQFGGESCPELVVELVEKGLVSEARIDQSVRRLLRMKFQLGLFDNPFVDEDLVPQVFGNLEAKAAGAAAQKRAMTLLKNEASIFPLQMHPKLFLKNIRPEVAARYGEVVGSPEAADFAILHLDTPWYPADTKNRFALSFHHGDLDFKQPLLSEILAVLNRVPTIVVMYMDRPAVIPEIDAACKGLLVEYGASDESILEVVFGKSRPEGKLPFELPSSMEAVRKQKADVPHDSENPLYPFGFGLSI
jgi:beta-glucosidase